MSVQVHCCIGGVSIGEDIRKLDYGQHVVSGTPGRVFGILYFVTTYKQSLIFLETLLSFELVKILDAVIIAGLEFKKEIFNWDIQFLESKYRESNSIFTYQINIKKSQLQTTVFNYIKYTCTEENIIVNFCNP